MTEQIAHTTGRLSDDAVLMQRIAAKDVHSFNVFVTRYQQFIMTICFNILNDREEAEDMAQEVFLKVFQNAKQFRGEAQIKTWLYRIAVNTTLNLKRKRRFSLLGDLFNTIIINSSEDPVSVVPEEYRPDRLLEREERRKIVYNALNQLPENQRTAIILNKFEGLSYKEIAEIMELSLSAIESIIHRAKKNLQKKLLKFITR